MAETKAETEVASLDRRKRYRVKNPTPLSVYFNLDVIEDTEALEALEALKNIYGGEKNGKSRAIKEILRIFYQNQKEIELVVNKKA